MKERRKTLLLAVSQRHAGFIIQFIVYSVGGGGGRWAQFIYYPIPMLHRGTRKAHSHMCHSSNILGYAQTLNCNRRRRMSERKERWRNYYSIRNDEIDYVLQQISIPVASVDLFLFFLCSSRAMRWNCIFAKLSTSMCCIAPLLPQIQTDRWLWYLFFYSFDSHSHSVIIYFLCVLCGEPSGISMWSSASWAHWRGKRTVWDAFLEVFVTHSRTNNAASSQLYNFIKLIVCFRCIFLVCSVRSIHSLMIARLHTQTHTHKNLHTHSFYSLSD